MNRKPQAASGSGAGVVGDFVTDQESKGRFGQLIERAGPRVQVNTMLVMQLPQGIVEAADGQVRVRANEAAMQIGERAIARGLLLPLLDDRENVSGWRWPHRACPAVQVMRLRVRGEALDRRLEPIEAGGHLARGRDEFGGL